VSAAGPNTKKTLLTTRRVGEFFGARSLVNASDNYSASAVGLKTVCLKLTKQKWAAYVAKNKALEQRITRCLNVGLEEALKVRTESERDAPCQRRCDSC
jgi:hypothetical protein